MIDLAQGLRGDVDADQLGVDDLRLAVAAERRANTREIFAVTGDLKIAGELTTHGIGGLGLDGGESFLEVEAAGPEAEIETGGVAEGGNTIGADRAVAGIEGQRVDSDAIGGRDGGEHEIGKGHVRNDAAAGSEVEG